MSELFEKHRIWEVRLYYMSDTFCICWIFYILQEEHEEVKAWNNPIRARVDELSSYLARNSPCIYS